MLLMAFRYKAVTVIAVWYKQNDESHFELAKQSHDGTLDYMGTLVWGETAIRFVAPRPG
jgi:hypothetical protein